MNSVLMVLHNFRGGTMKLDVYVRYIMFRTLINEQCTSKALRVVYLLNGIIKIWYLIV